MINKNVVDDAFNNPQSPYYSYRNLGYEYGAIEYKDGSFLAGPFEINNKQYGFYLIEHDSDALSIDEIIDSEMFEMSSCAFLPQNARNKINLRYGYSTSGYYNKTTNEYYSKFDFDNDTDLKEYYLINKQDFQYIGECTLFFKSPKSLQLINACLTNLEIQEWQLKIDNANAKLISELRNTCVCKEKPYSILLYGTDDCSYAINASDIDEVKCIIEQMKSEQYVINHMTYMN